MSDGSAGPQTANRPAVGIVCEGYGEYHVFPGLVARILGQRSLHTPLANARGSERLCRELDVLLDELVAAHKPLFVLVTLDLRDALHTGRYSNCESLKEDLTRKAQNWLLRRSGMAKYEPLPEAVIVVIQVQAFESWLIADCNALAQHRAFPEDLSGLCWTDVDQDVENPVRWLRTKSNSHFNPKHVPEIIKAFRLICVETVARQSRSFRKFVKEVKNAYDVWMTRIQMQD